MQDVEIRSAVFEDSALHFGICSISDLAAERFALALKLESRIARRTDIIDCGGAVRKGSKPWGIAGWTEEICCAP